MCLRWVVYIYILTKHILCVYSQVESYVKEHVLKEHDSKFKCQIGECAKAFKGYDYVEKHILSKHPEEIERIRTEAEYFNNYVCDPNHLLTTSNSTMNTMGPGAPFAQQPPFMMGNPRNMPGMHVPPVAGPWNQMPPMGFGPEGYWNPNAVPSIPNRRPGYPMPVDQSFSKDPRQVKSYVDLDAPAEGDSDISFY